MEDKAEKNLLLNDIIIIIGSILIAVILVRTGVSETIIHSTKNLQLLGSFVAGMFFTSIFTVPLAIVALGEIARVHEIWSVAIFGGLGSMVGDLIIFRFIKDKFSEHLSESVQHLGIGQRIKSLLKRKYFRWFTFLAGGLIIASPLPDELGVSLLGFTKMRLGWFSVLSFLLNAAGILIIGICLVLRI